MIIFILVLAGVVFYLWKFQEKPIQEEAEKFINLTISAIDTNTDKQIRTGYLLTGTSISQSGNTSEKGSILMNLSYNQTYTISNININDQKYYSIIKTFATSQEKIYNVKLELRKPGEITLSRIGKFNGVDNLSLNIKVNGYYQNPIICYKYGMHIVRLELLLNSTQIEKPEGFSKYFYCYRLENLEDEELEMPVDYKYWEVLDDEDYMEFALITEEFPELNNSITFRI